MGQDEDNQDEEEESEDSHDWVLYAAEELMGKLRRSSKMSKSDFGRNDSGISDHSSSQHEDQNVESLFVGQLEVIDDPFEPTFESASNHSSSKDDDECTIVSAAGRDIFDDEPANIIPAWLFQQEPESLSAEDDVLVPEWLFKKSELDFVTESFVRPRLVSDEEIYDSEESDHGS